MCISPQRHAIFRHLNRQKWSEHAVFLYILTGKCAFHHSGVYFFDIGQSKSGPGSSVFEHFHFRMCFSPQRRTILRHQNFQKWSRTLSFLTFLLPNVLFRHSGVQFCDIRTQNFQKWSRTLSFLTFLLPNVLFATAACNF